jgi:uncharacterized protein (DUF885 family)
MKMIQESLQHLTAKVEEDRLSQQREIENLEKRCNQQIQSSCDEQQTRLQDINHKLHQQIQNNQNSNLNILRSVLEERENSIEQKLNDNFQALISKLNCISVSPIRKKPTPEYHNDDTSQDSPMTEISEHNTNNKTNDIVNPCHKTALQRRNVNHKLPTTPS